MSENEKKKRAAYRKNREKWIFTQVVIVVVLTVAILISTIVAIRLKSKYYIGYTEGGSIDYNVFLKENDFYEEEYLGRDQSYVASLIDRIIADYAYEIDMDTEDVNYRYSYTVKSRLEILDDTSTSPIFNPEKVLVNVQNKSQNTSNKLRINEIIVINYDEYNDLANEFIHTYSLTRTTSSIVVTLEVDVLSDCEAFSGSAVDTYKSELRIPLTTETVNIKMTSAVPAGEEKMIACSRGAGSEAFQTTAIVLGVIDVLAIALLVAFIMLTRTPDVTYTARVKKIVSQYKSYIQKINNLFETHQYQIILVNTFEEMLEIRDTIQAPILMYENQDQTCTKFMIPTDSKLLYVYKVEVEGYVEPEIPKKEEAAPVTIVKPNITNVVRPVVKVVVTPPPTPAPAPIPVSEPEPEAEIETVVEEAEVEIDAPEEEELPVVIATVEAEEEIPETEEEIPETEEEIPAEEEEIPAEEEILVEEEIPEMEEETTELLDAIPEIEETEENENYVDAIDVFWKERKHKTYRYDPDGNTVEEGDVVLVPTRDEENDKDIVREAEVSRGNYKIDPAELNHPLKKIIGVVRRKAERVFTAMITPEEENTENNN